MFCSRPPSLTLYGEKQRRTHVEILYSSQLMSFYGFSNSTEAMTQRRNET